MKEWRYFINKKVDPKFQAKSEKFKAIRRVQIPHKCSRKGMTRLAEDMRKESGNHSSISRAQIWINSRIRKNGEPVNMDVANTIEKMKQIESESQSQSSHSVREDVISQVLGEERPRRVRALGRGANHIKCWLLQARDTQASQFQNEDFRIGGGGPHAKEKPGYWRRKGRKEVLVIEGRVVSSDPYELVHRIPLEPNAKVVLIEFPRKLNAFLWRHAPNLIHIGEAVGMVVSWPADRVILHTMDQFDNASAKSNSKNKCKLIDVSGTEIVAEGRVASTDPNELVHFVPLGTGVVKVWVENAKILDVVLWRPSSDLECIVDAVGCPVVWPAAKVVVESSSGNRC